jgi:hypothetical protein
MFLTLFYMFYRRLVYSLIPPATARHALEQRTSVATSFLNYLLKTDGHNSKPETTKGRTYLFKLKINATSYKDK